MACTPFVYPYDTSNTASNDPSGIWDMGDPVTSTIFSGINTSIKFAEFCLSLKEASEENRVFCRLIQRVRKDRAEAARERYAKGPILNGLPEKRAWIDDIILETDEALYTIGKLVEDARVDGEKGRTVTLEHRFKWVLAKRSMFLSKQSLLSTCHQSLSAAISVMHNLHGTPVQSPSLAPPAYTHTSTTEGDDGDSAFFLRAPSQRRPKPKVDYVLPESPPKGRSLSDEWRDAISVREGASSEAHHERAQEQPAHEPEDDAGWDDVTERQAINAAATAIDDCGGNSLSTTAIAASLRRSTTHERRRRMQAHLVAG